MDHHLIAKNNMYKKLLLFFADIKNSIIWANFQRLKDEIANFAVLNTTLDKYIQEHQLDITGITTDKNNAFADMVKITVKKAKKAYVWALDKNNADLTQLFYVQKSDFSHLAESMAFILVKNIRDAINTNIADMAGVNLTNDDVDLIDAAIAVYQPVVGTPAAAKASKQEAALGLENTMAPIDKSQEIITHLIESQYEEADSTAADMVKIFLLNTHIDKLPTHHSGIHVNVTDGSAPLSTGTVTGTDGAVINLKGVLIAILIGDITKTVTTDISGIGEIIKIKAGIYNVTISLAGYVTQIIQVTIVKGKIIVLNVVMKRMAL